MVLPKRKQNRLTHYDYRTPGYYFITICTQNKENLFWVFSDGNAPQLKELGITAQKCIRSIPEHYPLIRLDHYVVMPNHVHMILILDAPTQNQSCPDISVVVGQMKRTVSKATGRDIWQRSFHDHVIRGEQDYQKIWMYIEDNPRKWKEDCFYIE